MKKSKKVHENKHLYNKNTNQIGWYPENNKELKNNKKNDFSAIFPLPYTV